MHLSNGSSAINAVVDGPSRRRGTSAALIARETYWGVFDSLLCRCTIRQEQSCHPTVQYKMHKQRFVLSKVLSQSTLSQSSHSSSFITKQGKTSPKLNGLWTCEKSMSTLTVFNQNVGTSTRLFVTTLSRKQKASQRMSTNRWMCSFRISEIKDSLPHQFGRTLRTWKCVCC